MITITRIMNPVDRVEDLKEPLFVGEAYAHAFVIMPMKGMSFSGVDVTARMVRSDGLEVSPLSLLDPETNNIIVVLSPECYTVSGSYNLYIYAITDAETICVYSCMGEVLPTISSNGTASEVPEPIIQAYHDPAVTVLQAAVEALEGVTTSTQEAVEALQETVSNLPGSLTIGKGTEDEVTITPAQLKALLALLE